MKIEPSFFSWWRFVTAAIKLFIEIFGDQDSEAELKKNGFK